MKVVGLITEYNPFHNGHLYHLEESKKITNSTHSIAVMSGHFLQRGEPSIMDKWTRAKNAVDAGVDLVIELPTIFSCSSAEYFATGSVSLLNSLGIVDTICFGSEDGNIDKIHYIADLLVSKSELIEEHLVKFLKTGISYPKARELAISNLTKNKIQFQPNNILGIEYIKALIKLKSEIKPITINRVQADYMSLELKGSISSATGIRNHIFTTKELKTISNFIPDSTYESLKVFFNTASLINTSSLQDLILYKVRTSSACYISEIHDVSEGLEHRIKKAGNISTTYLELVESIVSKRFTKTRIQRILIKILLDIKTEYMGKAGSILPEYARILGFNKKGAELIKRIKKETNFQLITNINKVVLSDDIQNMLNIDIKATNIYNLFYPNSTMKKGGLDHIKKPYIKKSE